MNCSADIVTKQYLEQRLAEFSTNPNPDLELNVTQSLIRDDGGIGALILRLVGAAVQALGASLITAIGRAESALSDLAEEQRQQRQEQLDTGEEVRRVGEKTDNLEQLESQNKRQIDSLEGDVGRLDGEIVSLKSRVRNLEEDLADKQDSILDLYEKFVELANDIIFLRTDTDKNTESIETLRERERLKDRQQDERLTFLDVSLQELAFINQIYLREFGELFAQLTGSIAEDKQAIFRLEQDVFELQQRAPLRLPQPSRPTITTAPDSSGVTVTITTDGGSDAARIPYPDRQESPELNPQISLSRSGQALTVALSIGNKSTSDTEILPLFEGDQEITITKVLRQGVNLEELQQAAQRIEQNQSAMFGVLATVGTIGVNTFNRVEPSRLAEAAATGACNTLNGGCGQNFRNQIKADGLQNLQSLDTAGTAGILAQVATVKTRLDTLSNNLGVDRALNAYNLAVSTHNAVCLSRAVGETFGYVVDNVALASGFEWIDTEGSPISFSSALGSSFQGFMENAVGSDLYYSGIANFNKALRVYQTGQNVAWSVRGIVDPIQNIATTAADNTGKIGNALRRSGAVLENSYSILPEQNTVQSATAAKLATYTRSLEGIGEGLELFGEGTENIIEIQQTRIELQESSAQFEEAIANATSGAETTRTTGKTNSQPPEISLLDLVPQPIAP